jgi:hypothetical protein
VEEVGEDPFGDFNSRRDDQPEFQAREDDLREEVGTEIVNETVSRNNTLLFVLRRLCGGLRERAASKIWRLRIQSHPGLRADWLL